MWNAFFVIAGESTEKEAQRKEKNMGKAKKKKEEEQTDCDRGSAFWFQWGYMPESRTTSKTIK